MNKNTLLINKYKPTRFCDFLHVVGKDAHGEPLYEPHPQSFLQKQIAKNKILTLVVGEEETGKTTFLETILREYYDLPFAAYRSNVLHIHYLKEQGTAYYKNEVKYFCQTYCSIPGKKKTIVLDDLDYLSESNQTIFVALIDKYANHVNFVASCKFLHKVLYGIQTRIMIVGLNRLSVPHLVSIASRIVVEEGMTFESDALDMLIRVSKQKVNRMINCIDKIKLFSKGNGSNCDRISSTSCDTVIRKEMVYQLCANIQYTVYKNYFEHILKKELKEAIAVLYDLHDKGFSVIDILDNMFEYVKIINHTDKDAAAAAAAAGNYPCQATYQEQEEEEPQEEPEKEDSVFRLPISPLQVYQVIKVICKYITYFYNVHEDEIELALITNEIIHFIYL